MGADLTYLTSVDVVWGRGEEEREEDEEGEEGGGEAADGAEGEGVPEGFATDEEWDEAKDGAEHGEEDGYNFGVESADVVAVVPIFVDEVDGGVDGDAAKQHECGKSTLVKIRFGDVEYQEDSDEAQRNHGYHYQRQSQRVEEYGCGEEHDGNYKCEQQIVGL